jgi:hypothetical protein
MDICKSLAQVISCCANRAQQGMSCDGSCLVSGRNNIEVAFLAWNDTTLLHWHEEDWHGGDG